MRNRLILPASLILLFLFSCSSDERSEADRSFEAFAERFLDRHLAACPEEATALGDHRFDDQLTDFSAAGISARAVMYRAYRDTLRTIPVETLSPQHMVDYDIMQRALESRLFELEELREWQWNPLMYSVGEELYMLIARDFAPLEARMRSLAGRLRAIPGLLTQAQRNLTAPPAMHTQTAMLQNNGTIALLEETLQPMLAQLPEGQRDSLRAARRMAVDALRAYGYWLKRDLIGRARGDFRIGPDLYERKFTLRLNTRRPPSALLTEAERRLDLVTAAMYRTARELHTKHLPDQEAPQDTAALIRRVLDHLAEQRPNDSTVVKTARSALRRAEDFVRAERLVTLPEEPLEIIVMPEFQRGVAVAYCDAPGPLEENGETFFAIAPTPADWTDDRRASFYREYNDHMLLNLIVHEAMPGHYVQLAAANHTDAPTLLRSVFPSGVFAEGWATYAEELMTGRGFGGPELRLQQQKMYLRLLINAIIDQRIHMHDLSRADAMRLMMQHGFQEEGEAAAKWRRACLTSVQLSTYFYGNLRIMDIRARAERQGGGEFDIRAFHDELLSFGTIDPGYIPVLMKLPGSVPGRPIAEASPVR